MTFMAATAWNYRGGHGGLRGKRQLAQMDINFVSGQVVDTALKVHSVLGPGLLESAYEACLAYELRKRGMRVLTQLPVPVVHDGLKIDVGYRIDLLVEEAVIVEVKVITRLHPVHEASPCVVTRAFVWSVRSRRANDPEKPSR